MTTIRQGRQRSGKPGTGAASSAPTKARVHRLKPVPHKAKAPTLTRRAWGTRKGAQAEACATQGKSPHAQDEHGAPAKAHRLKPVPRTQRQSGVEPPHSKKSKCRRPSQQARSSALQKRTTLNEKQVPHPVRKKRERVRNDKHEECVAVRRGISVSTGLWEEFVG